MFRRRRLVFRWIHLCDTNQLNLFSHFLSSSQLRIANIIKATYNLWCATHDTDGTCKEYNVITHLIFFPAYIMSNLLTKRNIIQHNIEVAYMLMIVSP